MPRQTAPKPAPPDEAAPPEADELIAAEPSAQPEVAAEASPVQPEGPAATPPPEPPREETPPPAPYVSPPTRGAPQGEFDPLDEFFDSGTRGQKKQSGDDRFEALYLDSGKTEKAPVSSGAGSAFEDLYVSDDGPSRPSATPAPAKEASFEEDDEFFLDEEASRATAAPSGPPKPIVLGGILLFVILFAVAAMYLASGAAAPETAPAPKSSAPPTATSSGLELRKALLDEQAPPDTGAPEQAPEEGAPATGTAEPTPAPGPAAAPAPKPRPAPKAAPPPVAKTGTLQVVSNRRVVVYLDGNPLGYTPQKVPVLPGAHTLSASMPGRPDSEQVKQIDVSSGTIQRVEFSF